MDNLARYTHYIRTTALHFVNVCQVNNLSMKIFMSIFIFAFSSDLFAADTEQKHQGQNVQYDFGQQYQITSKVLDEERQLIIYLPEVYKQKPTEKFPVFYILEGQEHFKHAILSIEKMQTSGWIPASIIVAIPDNENTNNRDYRIETDNFLQFITTEVQAFVSSNFRANPYSTLFGHGASGTFVLETFIKDPSHFDNYIASNPYIRQPTIDRFESLLDKNPMLDQTLYFSVGTVLDNGSYNVEPVEKLAELLKNKAPDSLQWTYQYLPLHGVHSAANITLLDSLSVTFKDYQGPFIYSYQDFIDGHKMKGVKKYFKERAKKYHISDNVTIGSLMGLGFMLLDGGHPQEAANVLIENINNAFPDSVQLHRVLGRAYLKMESYQKAYDAYAKMVYLAKQQHHPRVDGFEELLEQVRKKL